MPRKAATPKPPQEQQHVEPIQIKADPAFIPDLLPNLAGVATANLVEKIVPKGGGFQASYINWSRTMQLLRLHAPGWLPELQRAPDGGFIHRAPVGGFLMIYFRNQYTKDETAAVPQAIMDNNNNSVPWERISARDITDSHRRGVCMAAAMIFGLAYELWAKLPLENGYADEDKPEVPSEKQYCEMIEAADTVQALREIFAEAWLAHQGRNSRGVFKLVYDARLNALEGPAVEGNAVPGVVYAPDNLEGEE